MTLGPGEHGEPHGPSDRANRRRSDWPSCSSPPPARRRCERTRRHQQCQRWRARRPAGSRCGRL